MNIDSEGEEQVCGRLLISCPAHLPQRGRDLFSCPHSCVPWTKNSDGCSRLLREHLGNASVPSKGRLPKYMSKKRWEGAACFAPKHSEHLIELDVSVGLLPFPSYMHGFPA